MCNKVTLFELINLKHQLNFCKIDRFVLINWNVKQKRKTIMGRQKHDPEILDKSIVAH